jgi:hypothetical protein
MRHPAGLVFQPEEPNSKLVVGYATARVVSNRYINKIQSSRARIDVEVKGDRADFEA